MSETTSLLPIFGSNRENAHRPGELLGGCKHVTVLFAGGMCEVPHFDARQILVNDRHGHAINLALAVADPIIGPLLYRRWRRMPFHPDVLWESQEYCKKHEPAMNEGDVCDANAAFHYFVAVWMGRSAKAGTDDEFKGNLPVRYGAGGGGSAVRYQSATRATVAFRRAFRRCEFSTLDVFELLGKIHDKAENGIYADPPSWPGAQGDYKHKFTTTHHEFLAQELGKLKQARIVVRYGEHELIRGLYPAEQWDFVSLDGRTQGNNAKAEVLIVRKR